MNDAIKNPIESIDQKEVLITIEKSKTFQISVKTDQKIEDILAYPQSKANLDSTMKYYLENPQEASDFDLVDESVLVLEAVNVDEELWK